MAENYDSTHRGAAAPAEAGLRIENTQIASVRGLLPPWRHDDRQDASQNIIKRLLDEANKRGMSLEELLRSDPAIVSKKIEAERSAIRRRCKLARQMSEEMAEVLPAEMVPSQLESEEIIEQLVQAASLSAQEATYVRLCSELGRKDYDLFAEILGVSKDELYRIAYKAKGKLETALPHAEHLLENHEHPIPPIPGEGGTWRRPSGRVV
jgi:hypothetical protein